MTIAARNKINGFNDCQVGKNLFFDMGSICAIIRAVHGNHMIECEVQNEGWIYENQTIVFERKKKARHSLPMQSTTSAQQTASPQQTEQQDETTNFSL